MTSDKFTYLFTISLLLSSCSNEGEALQGDYGCYLLFLHRSPEQVIIPMYEDESKLASCAELRVYVTCSEQTESSNIHDNSLAPDWKIERQLSDFLDPNHDIYTGTMPLFVEYRTEVCQSINISLYAANDSLINDITDQARFYYVREEEESLSESVQNLLIDSTGTLLGYIGIGTTIQDYLSYHPMIFPEARWIFPTMDKDAFSQGNYVKVTIDLENGLQLVADTKKLQARNNASDVTNLTM